MPRRVHPSCLPFVSIAALLACAPRLPADGTPPKDPALQAIIERMAKQEKLVKSCECLLTHRVDVTDPKMIPLINARMAQIGRRPGGHIITKEIAEQNSYVAHWWRKGKKERYDEYRNFDEMARAGAQPRRVCARDGEFSRGYSVHDTPNPANGALIEGSIYPVEHFINFHFPFSFLYEYGNTPYSELLARSPDAKVTTSDGQATVSFSVPRRKDTRFELVFDRDGSLIRRDFYAQYPKEIRPRIGSRHTFSRYRAYRNSNGESVRFPSTVDLDLLLGTTKGQPIIYEHVHTDVNSFQFNHEIPDGLFKLEFPAGCAVFDAIARERLEKGQ